MSEDRYGPIINISRLEKLAVDIILKHATDYGYWLSGRGDGRTNHLYLRRDGLVYTTCGSEGFFESKVDAEKAMESFIRKYGKSRVVSFKRDGKLLGRI